MSSAGQESSRAIADLISPTIKSLLVNSDNWIDTTLCVMYNTEIDVKSGAKVALNTYPR